MMGWIVLKFLKRIHAMQGRISRFSEGRTMLLRSKVGSRPGLLWVTTGCPNDVHGESASPQRTDIDSARPSRPVSAITETPAVPANGATRLLRRRAAETIPGWRGR